MTITALPTPPDPNDRSTFNARAYPWAVAQGTLATEINAVLPSIDAAAAASDAAVAAANFKGAWSSLTGALAIPASVAHNGKTWLLLASVADVTAHTPGVSASWQETSSQSLAQIQAAALSF